MRTWILAAALALGVAGADGAEEYRLEGDQVRELQRALAAAGHDVEVDGILGAQTAEALRRFQGRHFLAPTGRPDTPTLVELGYDFSYLTTWRRLDPPAETAEPEPTVADVPAAPAEPSGFPNAAGPPAVRALPPPPEMEAATIGPPPPPPAEVTEETAETEPPM